jgi:Flp pilus assembly protein CpaB
MLVDKSASAGDSRGTAAYVLEKGSVAMAMPITVKSSVADAIQVGDRVDLIVTMHSPSSTSISTQRLLADVLILQVGSWQKAQNQSGTASSIVTFQLKEQDALALEYTILHADALTMVLRPANDHELAPLEPVTFDYINQRFGFRLPR